METTHHSPFFQVLQSKSGLLFGVPVPEEFSADGEAIEIEIHAALLECTERNIHGKDVTPFVLARLNELTQGIISLCGPLFLTILFAKKFCLRKKFNESPAQLFKIKCKHCFASIKQTFFP